MTIRIGSITTEAPGSTSDLIGNVGSTTRRFSAQQVQSAGMTSQGQIRYSGSDLLSTILAPPTSGAILTFSSGSSIPAWSKPTSGATLIASSLGTPTWLAAGTSGQYFRVSTANNTQPIWQSDDWGVTVEFSSALAGQQIAFRVPFDCVISEWDMNLSTGATTATGSATVEVRVNGVSSTPATSANQISSGALPTISNAGFNGSSAISSWTSTSLTKDTWVTVHLATVSSADTVRFSLGGTKR